MISIKKEGYNWVCICKKHNHKCYTTLWVDALEAAYGHAGMHHKRPKPVLDITVSDGSYVAKVSAMAE